MTHAIYSKVLPNDVRVQRSLCSSIGRFYTTGLKASKPFNPKRDKIFEIWLERIEHQFKVANISDGAKTSSLVLLFDLDGYETTRHFDFKDESLFEEVKTKLKNYFAVTET